MSLECAHRFSHKAMAAVFEVIILYDDADYAEQAAWAAFDELDRLEAELSRFIENSDISRINKLGGNQPLQVGPAAFECLQICARIYAETDGAFDVTCCPSGMDLVKLNEARHTVQLTGGPVTIDLGGVGKGYAVDRMAELLREWGIDVALIHSGYSSVFAFGAPKGMKGWPVGAGLCACPGQPQRVAPTNLGPQTPRKAFGNSLLLNGRALSGSGLQKGAHIIDPHRGRPVEGKRAAWACAPNAATADALSTAFMVMTTEQTKQYCLRHPEVLGMVLTEGKDEKKDEILRFGDW